MPNSDVIAEHLDKGDVDFGNDVYRVRWHGRAESKARADGEGTLDEKTAALGGYEGRFRPAHGWKYSYFLKDAVEDIPEYVVPFEAFRG
jgi:mRNA (guanine-N7-)-methyltransferase